jgi:hypothetical protein
MCLFVFSVSSLCVLFTRRLLCLFFCLYFLFMKIKNKTKLSFSQKEKRALQQQQKKGRKKRQAMFRSLCPCPRRKKPNSRNVSFDTKDPQLVLLYVKETERYLRHAEIHVENLQHLRQEPGSVDVTSVVDNERKMTRSDQVGDLLYRFLVLTET